VVEGLVVQALKKINGQCCKMPEALPTKGVKYNWLIIGKITYGYQPII
jgi:hypothetical protein